MQLKEALKIIGSLESLLIIPLLTYILYAGKLFINYTNLSKLERIFLPPHKKLIIKISKFSFITISFSIVIYVIFYEIFGSRETVSLVNHLFIFSYVFLLVLMLFYLLAVFWNMFSIFYKNEINYYIIIDNEKEDKWYLRRYIEGIGLFIQHEIRANDKKIIKDWGNITFHEEEKAKKNIPKWIENNLTKYILGHLVILIILIIILAFPFSSRFIGLIILLKSILVISLAVLFKENPICFKNAIKKLFRKKK